jgi:hypothetical protein
VRAPWCHGALFQKAFVGGLKRSVKFYRSACAADRGYRLLPIGAPVANYSVEAPLNVNGFTLIPLFAGYFAGMTARPKRNMPFFFNWLLTASVQNQFKCGAGRMYARLPQMARSGIHFGPLLFSGSAKPAVQFERVGAGPEQRSLRKPIRSPVPIQGAVV